MGRSAFKENLDEFQAFVPANLGGTVKFIMRFCALLKKESGHWQTSLPERQGDRCHGLPFVPRSQVHRSSLLDQSTDKIPIISPDRREKRSQSVGGKAIDRGTGCQQFPQHLFVARLHREADRRARS